MTTSVSAVELRAAVAEDGRLKSNMEMDRLQAQARLIAEGLCPLN